LTYERIGPGIENDTKCDSFFRSIDHSANIFRCEFAFVNNATIPLLAFVKLLLATALALEEIVPVVPLVGVIRTAMALCGLLIEVSLF
jgi:hypothetical protein